MSKIAHLGTVTLDTKLATSKHLNADKILANGEDVAEMFDREHTYREMETRVKLQPEDNYILYTDDGTIVTANLSGVANGTRLFYNQTKLTEIPLSWKLDSITDGTAMCASCTNLTTFSFPLNNLSNGSGMFSGCNLNEESVENILTTIPEYSEGSHPLTMNMSQDAFEKFNEITGNYLMAPGTISYKGWEIASNASITIPVEELTTAIEEIVGEGKVIVDTVLTENKVVVHTDRVDDIQIEAVAALLERVLPQNVEAARYNHNIEISWRDLNKYAECTTVADMQAVNADYMEDLTSDKVWCYPLTELQSAREAFRQAGLVGFEGELPKLSDGFGMFYYSNLTSFNIELPMLISGQSMFQGAPINYFNSDLPEMTMGSHMFFRAKLTSFNTKLPKLNNGMAMFASVPTLSIFNVELPKLSDGITMFRDCILNKESALRVLNSIPAYTSGSHQLTIGIHIDHQTDDEVLEAIANAEAKGWTMTVQWNGTPTAQASVTYGLRKPPIYAKVSEMENGERYLDWGHYVTDPTDYKEFANLEGAREYYGLPSENIEEEELTNV